MSVEYFLLAPIDAKAATTFDPRLPVSGDYRALWATFGPGQFNERCWLLRPGGLQRYGELFNPPYRQIISSEVSERVVFAESDSGEKWGWAADGSVWECTRNVRACDEASGLLVQWGRGFVTPYFVPTGSVQARLYDVNALSGSQPISALVEQVKTQVGARVLRCEAHTASFFFAQWALLASIQTSSSPTLASTDTTLRLSSFDRSKLDGAGAFFGLVTSLGWVLERPELTLSVVARPP